MRPPPLPAGPLDWLERRSAWQFVAILYVGRWIALAPILLASHFLLTPAHQASAAMPEEWRAGSPLGLFVGLVLVPPILETVVECTLPYWVFAKVRNYRRHRPRRCWGFVAVSACLMAVLHPMVGALLPALVTGAFLAYCYAHFAARNVWQALLATTLFHAAINLVGWTLLVLSG